MMRINRSLIQQLISITIPCIFGWVFTYLSVEYLKQYTFGLFIWLPFVLGTSSTLLLACKQEVTKDRLRNNAYITLLFFCIGLLVFAWEGLICLVMVAPLGVLFTYLGYLFARQFVKRNIIANTLPTIILLIISVPTLMAFEYNANNKEEWRSVTTSIDISATPEKVWINVVAFPELKEPSEFIFKTGIAYPINATITGKGIGAVRSCNFSTGSFIEPITVWDESKLLRFTVDDQPEPLKELSFYNIHPNHLHGYWVSKQGQFKLTRLPNGHTLLEGTTWYVNKIKPELYWTLWSDYIVHQIHNRVLEHIKNQAESK